MARTTVLFDVVTRSPEDTMAFGRTLADALQPPCLALLEGELGSGKTTLVKGIAAGLGAAAEEEVTSPSFTLVHEYSGKNKVYHVDLYRLEGAREISTLGLEELVAQRATVLIEWGEKLGTWAPASYVRIRLEHLSGGGRRLVVERIENHTGP